MVTAFPPIAIVGRGCVLPGAFTPADLWTLIARDHVAVDGVPAGHWRASSARILRRQGDAAAEGAVTDRGGFVTGFDAQFQPDGFALPAAEIAAADRLTRWLLHAGRAAMADAGLDLARPRLHGGAVVGNLGYPSEALARFAEGVWMGTPDPARARDRFNGGLPISILCQALNLGLGGFALDAACASSLYALKLACDRLHAGEADVMLAGAINAIDPLVLHTGFTALSAISPSGQSRPFHRDADGLLPAEGAVLFVLRRYDDAVRDGDRIHGVIRGVGLSNDGRAGGILSPAREGQEAALRRALEVAGVAPAEVGFIECHATGTQIGDAVELAALRAVFGADRALGLGSLKANLGHLVTASGGAGVLKVLAAMAHDVLPGSPASGPYTPGLADTGFRVVTHAEPWPDAPRRIAGVSSFGFGGNNAHVIIESPDTFRPAPATQPTARAAVGIVAVGYRGRGTATDLQAHLFDGAALPEAPDITLPMAGLRIPPNDLRQSVPQHALMLAAALESIADVTLPANTAVIVGAQCAADACRHAYRLRLPDLAPDAARDDAGVGAMVAAHVIGCMPNMPANRLNAQCDLRGPSFTVAAEEASGLEALRIAARMLETGEIDAALVGAVDTPDDPVTGFALAQLLPDRPAPADAAVSLVLKRVDDARAAGETVLAVLDDREGESWTDVQQALDAGLGHAHVAAGLRDVAAAVFALARRTWPRPGRKTLPWLANKDPRRISVTVTPLMASPRTIHLREDEYVSLRDTTIRVYEGDDIAALRAAVAADRALAAADLARPGRGPRAAIHGAPADIVARRAVLLECLDNGTAPRDPNIALAHAPLSGDVAFVFTGAAAAYRGMGQDLLRRLPVLADRVHEQCPLVRELAGWIYDLAPQPHMGDYPLLTASSFLCQAHAALTRDVLAITPQAAIGLSSGETNALFALGAWTDMAGLMTAVRDEGLYAYALSGAYAAVHAYWDRHGIAHDAWETWQILAPVDDVRAALVAGADLAIVTAPDDCIIAGTAAACGAAVKRLGPHRATRLNISLACHTPAIGDAAGLWRRLHNRSTAAPGGVRFYSNAHNRAYEVTQQSVADALTHQAAHTVDFPATIRQAWDDGVRIFIEHGPRDTCARAIRAVLGDRPHLAVALDRFGASSWEAAAESVLQLLAAGVPMRLDGFVNMTEEKAAPSTPLLRLPARWPAVPGRHKAAVLPLPPRLAPVRDQSVAWPQAAAHQARASRRDPMPGAAAAAARLHESLTAQHLAYMQTAAHAHAAFLHIVGGIAYPQQDAPPRAVSAPVSTPAPLHGRADLEKLSSGRLSEVWGEQFAVLDDVTRIVRMPMPPLLLADRVMTIDAVAGSMTTGSIVTETDVTADAWYVHHGRMPAGLVVESGQADLLLISWLGIDFLNRGERVYRLLGCELTYHGPLPAVGETLRYDIAIDSHTSLGDVRLFFFHYDCHVAGAHRISVRNGQAGFFTDEELADSDGVLWSAETTKPKPLAESRLDKPTVVTDRMAFDRAALDAFAKGDLAACFGPAFSLSGCHTRSPAPPVGRMLLLERVTHFQPKGGPWGRGYLRAEWPVSPNDWFFDGHFKNDPCMPGTLMFEACLQAMSVYMAGLGLTLNRDGWRFEPLPEETFRLRCRGQVTPRARNIVYEVHVEELALGPQPVLWADVLCTVDGLKAFHCPRLALRLVPDWPMAKTDAVSDPEPARPSAVVDGFAFDYRSLMACAVGRPSEAFGPFYRRFDDGTRVARLPGDPYHFMTRIARIDGAIGGMTTGAFVSAEYTVPPDAWYFAETPRGAMPYAVLMEVGLQPCGWLASYIGAAREIEGEVYFRNLDGTARVHGEVTPATGRLITDAKLTSLSRAGAMIILAFHVTTSDAVGVVHEMETVFGFFPAEALAAQAGLAPSQDDRALHDAPAHLPFILRDTAWGRAVAGDKMLMVDRITGWWPDGGAKKQGLIRGEKAVDPESWFFKAHFFQDPVQPGSLGVEAMLQVVKADLLRRGYAQGAPSPAFLPVTETDRVVWKYRGQVRPWATSVVTQAEILERRIEADGVTVVARASAWVDGLKIYEATLGTKLIFDRAGHGEQVFDVNAQPWLADHAPTYVIPALPLMAMADRILCRGTYDGDEDVPGLVRDFTARRWLAFGAEPQRTRLVVDGARVTLETEKPTGGFVAVAVAANGGDAPALSVITTDAPVVHERGHERDLYRAGHLFHGPAFQGLARATRGADGGRGWLDVDARMAAAVRRALLLDGVTHIIPNDALEQWVSGWNADHVGYPTGLAHLRVHAPLGAATRAVADVRCIDPDARHPRFAFQVRLGADGEGGLWADGVLIYTGLPKGPLGRLSPTSRRAFLADAVFVEGAGLSCADGAATVLDPRDVAASDWLPGTVAAIYGCAGLSGRALSAAIVAKDHVARRARVHPSAVAFDARVSLCTVGERAYPVKVIEAEVFTAMDVGSS